MRLQGFSGHRGWKTAVTLYCPALSPSGLEGLISVSTYTGLHVSMVCALSSVLEKREVLTAAGQGEREVRRRLPTGEGVCLPVPQRPGSSSFQSCASARLESLRTR